MMLFSMCEVASCQVQRHRGQNQGRAVLGSCSCERLSQPTSSALGSHWQQTHGKHCCGLSRGLKHPGFIHFGILTHRQRGYQRIQCISPIAWEKKKKKTGMNGINLTFKKWYLTGLSLPVCQCQQRFNCINQLWFFPGCQGWNNL